MRGGLCKSLLIVIEGIDGAGKTTIAKSLAEKLNSHGIRSVYTYEPFNDLIVNILNRLGRRLGPVFEALMMAADRYYHVEEIIKPALRDGLTVISDRYVYSSIAYQGAQGVPISWIKTINEFAPRPDLAIYLDVPVELGIKRKKTSTTRIPYLESSAEMLERARKIYMDLVKDGELILVDASLPINEVLNRVVELAEEVINKKTMKMS